MFNIWTAWKKWLVDKSNENFINLITKSHNQKQDKSSDIHVGESIIKSSGSEILLGIIINSKRGFPWSCLRST